MYLCLQSRPQWGFPLLSLKLQKLECSACTAATCGRRLEGPDHPSCLVISLVKLALRLHYVTSKLHFMMKLNETEFFCVWKICSANVLQSCCVSMHLHSSSQRGFCWPFPNLQRYARGNFGWAKPEQIAEIHKDLYNNGCFFLFPSMQQLDLLILLVLSW